MSDVRLFLIDEIHVLGEASRGAVVEAVISRMKMLAVSSTNRSGSGQEAENSIRFIAVSATIPNIDDV
jgi:replicative superfamily II helicase